MTKWYEPGRWLLIAALAAQFAGCAQTSQWVGKISGRDKTKEVAEVDGRDKTASKQKERVKIASDGKDAKKKASKHAKDGSSEDAKIAVKPKSQAKPTAKQPPGDEIAQASQSDQGLSDPFAEQNELPKSKRSMKSLLPRLPAARQDVAETAEPEAKSDELAVKAASHRRPDVAVNDPQEAAPEIAATSAVVDETVTRKLSKLQPSQASFTQLCPAAEGDVRELVKSLDDQNLEHVKRSLHRLGRIGPDAAAAKPALDYFLTHKDGYVRVHAALATCRIDGVSPAALDTLTATLKAPDPGLRSFAAAVIAELGPAGGDATPALAIALEDPDAYVRLHVAEVLIRNADWSEASLEALLTCLRHRDENVRWLTSYSLAELAPQSSDAVDALIARLDDESTKVRIGAIYALGEIGALSAPALADLQRHTGDSNAELRTAVAYAVEQIENGANQEE